MTSPIDKLTALAEERDAKATKGPWFKYDQDFGPVIATTADDGAGRRIVGSIGEMDVESDTDFVVASRAAWPATAKALKVARDVLNRISYVGATSGEPAERTIEMVREALAEIDRIAPASYGEDR